MIVCRRCGRENAPGARFCSACGNALAATASPKREERKVVTVLFADLVGFTSRAEQLDPEDVRAMLSPYYARLRAELERFEGSVEKFSGDAVMAVFGAPVAHEDDPERAVRAALAIREAINELNERDPSLELRVRVGVNTGEALVALDADPGGEGMVAGDVVNTTARLQAVAPVNGILAGETTYRATAHVIEYRTAEAVDAKGKERPVPAWEVLSTRARLGVDVVRRARVPLVGREREFDVLLGAFSRARAERSPQLVTLVGVPGIGKSRLVLELLQVARDDPQLILWRQGRSLPYGHGVTFWALGEMVKAHAGILEADPPETAEEKLARATDDVLGAEAEWVRAHLRPLVGLGRETELALERGGESFAAWRRFFEALAERHPVVLVFEDLHWAEDRLLDFVDHLVDWAADVPILIVCTARPELLGRRPEWGGGKRNAATIALSPLTPSETARLVAALLEQAVIPVELQQRLLARAEGNPLYAEQYVRMLIDRGLLVRGDDGRWRIRALRELPLPESVQGIIAARLDGLPADEKALLQDAAVLGKVFSTSALTAVSGIEGAALERLLHALVRKEFVRRERRSSIAGEAEFAFSHLLIGEVAYAQVPRGRRAAKHQLAAEWLESLGADRREDQAETIAHHYLSALELSRAAGLRTEGLAARARLAFRDAGDHALAINAFQAAIRLYRAALDLWPEEHLGRAELLFRYGEARFLADEPDKEVLEEAREQLLARGDAQAAAEAELMLAALCRRAGENDDARDRVQRAADLVRDAPPSRSKGRVLAALAHEQVLTGHLEDAVRIAREAFAMADELDDDDLRARALEHLGGALVGLGDLGGMNELKRGIDLFAKINSPRIVRARTNLAAVFVYFGDLRRGFELQREAREDAARFGDVYGRRHLDAERVPESYWTGRWDDALALAGEFLLDERAPDYMQLTCRIVRARIALARGTTDALAEEGQAFVERGRAAGEWLLLFPALAIAARVALVRGGHAGTESLVDELLDQWRELQIPAFDWVSDLAFAAVAVGRRDELLEVSSAVPNPTRWVGAAKSFVLGDYARSAERYAQIGSLPDEALARLRLAETMVARGRADEAEAELARALAFYRSVGATAYVQTGEQLVAASA